ncbi:anti-anti-sigma factor [Thermocatellispora tengchongensis]|uniref:Anti-sigma factor antagonist n=1 Tax=Thermocatellispora tengchongensis TaxID=1073253 RepID=A0A840PJZ1_9ACTN|nr:STAS domain-containing protein [Thermocatellispora tengchongensis]MBB5138131.1 anti-anti-sigma factor [Thermocatellispora tengchongensis]
MSTDPDARAYFAVELGLHGACVVAHLAGELDCTTADELRSAARSAWDDLEPASMVLDLGEVTFVDSSGIGVLVHIMKTCDQRGIALYLSGVGSFVRRLLRITGLEGHFTICDSVEDALIRAESARPVVPEQRAHQ